MFLNFSPPRLANLPLKNWTGNLYEIKNIPGIINIGVTTTTVLGSNGGSGRNSAVQGVTGSLSLLHGSSGVGTSQDIHSTPSNIALIKEEISGGIDVAGAAFIAAALFKFNQHSTQHHQHPVIPVH